MNKKNNNYKYIIFNILIKIKLIYLIYFLLIREFTYLFKILIFKWKEKLISPYLHIRTYWKYRKLIQRKQISQPRISIIRQCDNNSKNRHLKSLMQIFEKMCLHLFLQHKSHSNNNFPQDHLHQNHQALYQRH